MVKRFVLKKEYENEEALYYIYDNASGIYLECFDDSDVGIAKNLLSYLNGLDFEIKRLEQKLAESQRYRSIDNIELGEMNVRLTREMDYITGLHKLRKKTLLDFIDDLIYENTVLGKSNSLEDVKVLISKTL